MKRFMPLVVILAVFLVPCFVAPAPLMAFSHDTDYALSGENNIAEGLLFDLTTGQFDRGMQATGEILKKHPVLQFPLFAIPLGIFNSIRYELAVPVQLYSRISGENLKVWQSSNLAIKAANNPIYVGVMGGALTGGLLAFSWGSVSGLTMIETYALDTAGGAIAGTIFTYGVDKLTE